MSTVSTGLSAVRFPLLAELHRRRMARRTHRELRLAVRRWIAGA